MSLSSGSLGTTIPRMAAIPAKSVHKQIFRALLALSSAALLVRVIGMLNQIVVTKRFGAGAEMDAYFVASTLPLLMATLLSSSIESSVIPVYAQVRTQGKEQVSILFSTLLNLLVLATILLTLGMLTFRSQLIQLSAPALDPFRAALAVNLLADGGDKFPGMHSQRRRSVRLACLRRVIGTAHHRHTCTDARQIGWRRHTLYRYAGGPLPGTLRDYRTRATCRTRLSA